MNVSISYVVDFDELPIEVRKLLVEARVSIENSVLDSFEEAENSFDNKNYFSSLESIEKIRRQLVKIDTRLNDCHSILADYQKILLGGDQQEEVEQDQLTLDFEGSDVTMDEDGNISVEKKDEEG